MRGVTVGPIESALHPGHGYGTARSARAMLEARRLGASWVSVTPFGRVLDLRPSGVDPTFEAPHAENRGAVARAVHQAHAEGLRVMIVPHLWVENGEWRALIDPGDDAAWGRWAASYREWVVGWAAVARDAGADLFSVGVELRSWATTPRATSLVEVIRAVRAVYPGPVTYAANWDDVESTVVLGELDVIGVNAFFPLAEREGARLPDLVDGGRRVAAKMGALAREWQRPVLFTEIGYTTRRDPAVKPWEWPDSMKDVVVDEAAQADAYSGLLAPLVEEEWFAGFFVWRTYADPDDLSQEAEWGFSPRGKLAELVLRDAFSTHWAADGPRPVGHALARDAALGVGFF
ncbi:MAG: hypothetical protein IT376_16910 [Polyangiaceae bacterium]|nr:hypothetical protein [Polyangiaceae bacterium]